MEVRDIPSVLPGTSFLLQLVYLDFHDRLYSLHSLILQWFSLYHPSPSLKINQLSILKSLLCLGFNSNANIQWLLNNQLISSSYVRSMKADKTMRVILFYSFFILFNVPVIKVSVILDGATASWVFASTL